MFLVNDFKCGNCGEMSELFLKKDEIPKCKECGSENVYKILSSPALLKTNFADKNSHRSR